MKFDEERKFLNFYINDWVGTETDEPGQKKWNQSAYNIIFRLTLLTSPQKNTIPLHSYLVTVELI